MTEPPNSSDPLHGITLKQVLVEIVGHYGWKHLAAMIPLRCFLFDPTINSSLKFLRQNPRERARVEELYVAWKSGRGPARRRGYSARPEDTT